MKKFLFLIALFTLMGGVNSVKAEKFVSLGSVLTLAEAEAASTSGTGVAIVYDNSKLFANATGGDPKMSLVGVNCQHLVEGSEKNGLKLTRPQDVELFKALIHSDPEPWMK